MAGAAGTEGEERRRDVRARITVPTFIVWKSGRVAVEMVDASYRGLFLRMREAPPVRHLLRLRIALPSREIDVHAVVVRVVDDAFGRPGVGLRFFALNGQDRADWESFISLAVRERARAA